VVNTDLIAKRRTWSSRLIFLGFALLLGSFFLTLSRGEWAIFLAYVAMITGFIIFTIGMSIHTRWVREPRCDQMLEKALKGLDNKFRLYSYVFPAEHVVLTPSNITVVEMRRVVGPVTNTGDRWSHRRGILQRLRFAAEEQVGNPTKDAQAAAAAMREYLRKNLPDVDANMIPIDPVIVFGNGATLTVTEPRVPVMTIKQVKDYMRRLGEARRLTPEQYGILAKFLDSALPEGA
jgi:hypothetical protein